MRTRRSFAAPFVLVVGCSSGGGTPPERTPPPPPVAAPADAAVDAAERVAMAPDAAVPPDAASLEPPTRGKDPVPKYPECPGTMGPENRCNPPQPRRIEARIVEAHEEAGLVITVDKGQADGIDKRWKIELRGTNGGWIPKFRGQIVRITKRSTEFRFSEKADRPISEFRVSLVAP